MDRRLKKLLQDLQTEETWKELDAEKAYRVRAVQGKIAELAIELDSFAPGVNVSRRLLGLREAVVGAVVDPARALSADEEDEEQREATEPEDTGADSGETGEAESDLEEDPDSESDGLPEDDEFVEDESADEEEAEEADAEEPEVED